VVVNAPALPRISATRSTERPALSKAATIGFPVLAACLALLVLAAPQARAVILPATTIDGPSEEIVGFGGVAMAEDGTGGLVYLKRVDGVAHVFVARYLEGHWLAPIRVDTEQPFAASWPRIGAANGGELVVVWATPFATEHEHPVDELLGATLGPGSASFGHAMIVDPNVGSANGTTPDLAMSSTGQADIVYRVVRSGTSSVILHPGDVVEDVRVAHFDGTQWSRLGAINRNPGLSMRPPTQANAPQIAVGPTGNAVVVWQEPEINGVARIWARRLFGTTLDFVLPVSAASFNGAPIDDDADAPSVAISRLGQAEVAYRQNAGQGSPLPGPRIFLNTLPDGESVSGAAFLGASVADPTVAGGASASIGPPSIDIDEKQNLRILYDANGTPTVVQGNDKGLSGSVTLGPPFAGPEDGPVSVMNPQGGGVSAWSSAHPAGQAAVAVREDFPGGAAQTALVSGGGGGEIGELSVGRSGLGDGLVGFRQGPIGHAAIVAAQATTPPAPFFLTAPSTWIEPSQAAISWVQAPSANGPITYRVVLDGRVVTAPTGALSARLEARRVASGVHRVQLLATDIDGQEQLTGAAQLRVDGQAPTVTVLKAEHGRGVKVRITDGGVGVAKGAVSVSFGDGARRRGKTSLRHRYKRAGIYTIVAHVGDKLGNKATVRRLVSVR
jgi:hypothetical protein